MEHKREYNQEYPDQGNNGTRTYSTERKRKAIRIV